jgi:hypothetical protein
MTLTLWLLVVAIASVKIASFAVSVRRALRPHGPHDSGGQDHTDPPDGGPDWDWWERDLLPPDPDGNSSSPSDDRRVLIPT